MESESECHQFLLKEPLDVLRQQLSWISWFLTAFRTQLSPGSEKFHLTWRSVVLISSFLGPFLVFEALSQRSPCDFVIECSNQSCRAWQGQTFPPCASNSDQRRAEILNFFWENRIQRTEKPKIPERGKFGNQQNPKLWSRLFAVNLPKMHSLQ